MNCAASAALVRAVGLAAHRVQRQRVLLQLEAALIPEQTVEQAWIDLPTCDHFARVPAQDDIGERIWLRLLMYSSVLCASLWLAYELRFDFKVEASEQRERCSLAWA